MKSIGYLLCLLLMTYSGTAQTPTKPRRIWLDTDQMIGMKDKTPREVDDAIALIMALQHPDKIELVGISTITYANYGYEVVQKLLTWYNRTGKVIPVYRGSDMAKDVGTENDATRAMANALRTEKMPILAIGPVTNVATVVKNYPELISQIEEVVVCAGRSPGLPFRPGLEKLTVRDYNFETDPESFRILFDAGVKMVLSGYECSIYTFLGKTDIDFLNNKNESDKWVYDQLRPWQQFNQKLFGVDGFVPWDTTPLGYFTHPNYFKYHRDIPVTINVRQNDAGTTDNKPYLEASYDYKDTKWRATYAYKTLPGFEEIVIEDLKRASSQNVK
ncbi:nucleoside hydrolase [Spirosoma arcticum]